jgi:hypothetical protein
MAGISFTGQSDTNNYVLGRGCVFLSFLDKNGTPRAWREVGNATEFTLEGDSEVLEHFTNKTRQRVKDLELSIENNFSFTAQLDEWMYENLAIFTAGKIEQFVRPASAAGLTPSGIFGFANPLRTPGVVTAPFEDVKLGGRYYDVYFDADDQSPVVNGGLTVGTRFNRAMDWKHRVYGLDPAEFTLTINSIAYTEGSTTFTYDPEAGHIYIPGNSSMLGSMGTAAVAAGANNIVEAAVTYDAPISLSLYDQMQGGTSTSVAIALKYILFNGADDTETHEIILHKVRMRPTGSVGLISDTDLATIPLSGGLEINSGHDSTGAGLVTIRKVTV